MPPFACPSARLCHPPLMVSLEFTLSIVEGNHLSGTIAAPSCPPRGHPGTARRKHCRGNPRGCPRMPTMPLARLCHPPLMVSLEFILSLAEGNHLSGTIAAPSCPPRGHPGTARRRHRRGNPRGCPRMPVCPLPPCPPCPPARLPACPHAHLPTCPLARPSPLARLTANR